MADVGTFSICEATKTVCFQQDVRKSLAMFALTMLTQFRPKPDVFSYTNWMILSHKCVVCRNVHCQQSSWQSNWTYVIQLTQLESWVYGKQEGLTASCNIDGSSHQCEWRVYSNRERDWLQQRERVCDHVDSRAQHFLRSARRRGRSSTATRSVLTVVAGSYSIIALVYNIYRLPSG